MKLEDTPVIA